MNVLTGFSLYLFSAFLLIVLCVLNILPQNYLGGFVIAGFIGGVCFPFFNAIRQGEKMIEKEIASEILAQQESKEKRKLEEPIIAR